MTTSSIVGILRRRAQEEPGQQLFTYLEDGENEGASLTAGELDLKSRTLAAYLQERGLSGQRILLAYPPGLDFIIGFFGCLYAGVIAVPVYPPRRNRHDARLDAIAQDADVAMVMTTGEIADESEQRGSGVLKILPWLATDRPLAASPDDWQSPRLAPQDIAYLQYTSGSTGVPRGVMVSHDNVIQNSKSILAAVTICSEACAVTWLPSFHDMGLVDGILQPLYTGFCCYLMAPQAFIERPVRWLQAISRHRATHSGGPDFGYRLCVDRVTVEERDALDLSCWVNAYSGAESVRAETLRRFAEYFASTGFQSHYFFPCYGMAETTLIVSGGPLFDAPKVLDVEAAALEQHRVVLAATEHTGKRTVVGCGQPCINTEVAIVQPNTGRRCRQDGVGEIWVAGASVTQGYWNRPAETAESFAALIEGTGEGPFLRTGDLGFMYNGQLYITGRLKDLIIIRGRNHYPQDIEQTSEKSHLSLRPGAAAAFSVEVEGEERLVLVHEVKRAWLRKFDVAEVAASICAAVTAEHDVAVHALCFVKPSRLPMTSSGKVQRRNAKAAWLSGELETVSTWIRPIAKSASSTSEAQFATKQEAVPPAGSREIGRWLRQELARRLELPFESIDEHAPLAQYGLDSVAAVELTSRLQSRLGAALSPTIFYDCPTIDSLVAFLAGKQRQPAGIGSAVGEIRQDEPIAVVGMGCRYPGAASPAAFWRQLVDGVDAITRFPASRENADLFTPDSLPPQSARVAWGGFLNAVEGFDAHFFGIAPREAESMDPQQRLLLEVAWEALEDAGLDLDRLAGSATGVFVGVSNFDYGRLVLSKSVLPDAWAGTGNALSIAANRLSYFFNLHGPSVSVDTACSSSLVAVHQACASLRNGECQLSLAGGANLILSPELSLAFVEAGMMAADGRCKTFDAAADGYVRGEGCGIVVLKRLSDAQRDGDHIWAVIRGSAVNQDGRSNGLTAPNGPSQKAVIEQAIKAAGIAPADIGLVEAHGTGTSLGDPIELNTLSEVLLPGRTAAAPCWIGSVKTNIGHLEAAAGIAGLMKAVLALHHGKIPPHLHLKELNPLIKFDGTLFRIPTETVPWPNDQRSRMAGVSSFGFGGTNAHVVLSEAPASCPRRSRIPGRANAAQQPALGVERPLHILNLSAKSEPALRDMSARLAEHLRMHHRLPLADVCFSAATGRSHLTHRLSLIGDSVDDAIDRLSQFAAGMSVDPRTTGKVSSNTAPRIAFLMTGQGSQYVGMGRGLYDTQPVFRQTLNLCAELLAATLEQPLLDVLFASDETQAIQLDDTQYTQPALFALEYALAQLWRTWGIEPEWVMGHSVGEYVAACLAGVFSLEDGLKLIAARGRLMQSLPRSGGMLAVAANESAVSEVIRPWPTELSLAAINGPGSTVVSGRLPLLAQVARTFADRGVKTTELTVSHAFHSPLVEPILDEFSEAARAACFSPPSIPIVSNVTGGLVTDAIATPEYWREHVRQPVQFERSIRTLRELGASCFLEIGPKPTLLAMGRECLPDEDLVWLPSLRPKRSDWSVILESLRTFYLSGARVDWQGFDQGYSREKVSLPTYPFQRQHYWFRSSSNHRPDGGHVRGGHPLLGFRLVSPLPDVQFHSVLSARTPDYLNDHRVFQKALMPAAAFLEMGLAAGKSVLNGKPFILKDISFDQALELSDEPVTIQTVVSPKGAQWDWRVLRLHAGDDSTVPEDWTTHLSGTLAAIPAEELNEISRLNLSEQQALIGDHVKVDSIYDACAASGLDYGAQFRALSQVWRTDNEALARLQLPAELKSHQYQLHPVLIDACFQLIAAVTTPSPQHTFVPARIEQVRFHDGQVRGGWGHARVQKHDSEADAITADVTLIAEDGQPIAEFQRLMLRRVDSAMFSDETLEPIENWLYELQWRPAGLRSSDARALPLDFLPITRQVTAAVSQFFHETVSGQAMRRYGEGITRLNRLSVEFVIVAFRKLGLNFQRRGMFSQDDLFSDLGIVDQHRRLAVRMLEMLEESGVLARSGREFRVICAPAASALDEHLEGIRRDYPEVEVELELLERCASRLDEVLRGDRDPLHLLFPQGDLTSVARLYHDAPGAKILNAAIQQAVAGFIEQRPWWRSVRILEIGAGTGGTTAGLLPHLPAESTDYVFTDVSAIFTEQARERFREFDFIRYRSLDIERAPSAQGFAEASFDLVVAANVLHATSDIRRTLGHIRQLLAPGGALVVLEGTRPVGWIDLIFGLTKQWWAFTDNELRTSHPLLSAAGWERELRHAGFRDVSVAGADFEQESALAHQAIIVARTEAIAPCSAQSPLNDPGRWVIFTDESGVARRLVEQLMEQGRNCVVLLPGESFREVIPRNATTPWLCEYSLDPRNPAHYERLFQQISTTQEPIEGVVYFWGPTAAQSVSKVSPQQLAARTGIDCLLHAVQAFVTAGLVDPPAFWMITRDACAVGPDSQSSGLWQSPLSGMAQTIALEHPELQFRQLDLGADWDELDYRALFEEIWSLTPERRVAFHGRRRRVARLARIESATSLKPPSLEISDAEAFRLTIPKPGSIDELLIQKAYRRHPGSGQVEIRVSFAGLNFRDVLSALDLYPGDAGPLGGECAGTVTAVGRGVSGFQPGDRVIAIAPGSMGDYVTVDSEFVLPCLASQSLAEAATIPIAFATAWYTLIELAGIHRGERVLIHAAAGGVGQAAIQVARHIGAEVFCTASSAKADVLKSLGVEHIFDSRTVDFAKRIDEITRGEGVDVVLNSLTGEAVSSSLSLLRNGGRFLEIGKRDVRAPSIVAQAHRGVRYHTFDLAELCRTSPKVVQRLLADVMACFANGTLRPLPARTFDLEQARDAFRFMQQARHTGKILLRIPSRTSASSHPAIQLRSDATYLITGGLGALGLFTARWMTSCGARHLMLISRGAADQQAQSQLAQLEAVGAQVRVVQADVAVPDQLQHALDELRTSLPPLRGVVHAAGLLDDGVLTQQTPERFSRVMLPKVAGAWNLHVLTQSDPLDFFVMYSSAASLLGSAGQANHSAGNAFLDTLAHFRRAARQPALSINWGAWAGIGEAEERQAGERFRTKGMGTIAPDRGLQLLERLWDSDRAQVGVLPINWPQFLEYYPDTPLLADFQAESDRRPEMASLKSILDQTPSHERVAAIKSFVAAQVAHVLRLQSADDVDPETGFFDLGMDSLTSVELKNRLQRELACSLPATVVFDFPNVEALTRFLATEALQLEESSEDRPSTPETDKDGDQLDDVSEAELAELLTKKISAMSELS
jgi:acyl transferase domain-containing protein/acyl-CoA synthetase (AMP-forming)/AMP-acid ligase II/NADPH:quinone reductase-like Zn-dependent oxidoreductase/acyl carrier protein